MPAEDPRVQRINATVSEYPRTSSIVDLFERRASSDPQATAIDSVDCSLTFREIDERSNQLARYLAGTGVSKGDLVGVCIERTVDVPVVLLAILKAGSGYVPLDPEYPRDRLRYMWVWRDWLIRSLNDDVPFDRLTREALAGDLLPAATPRSRSRSSDGSPRPIRLIVKRRHSGA